MNWKFWQKSNDIQFVDTTRRVYNTHPIQLAKNVKAPFQATQMNAFSEYKFAICPGMIDYKNFGYIVPAWDDIHILANKAGTAAVVGGGSRATAFAQARGMDPNIVEGIFQPDEVPLAPIHVGSPWSIFVNNKKMSAMLMPAFYHSSFLDDLYVFPGIVDYGNFTVMNFIFAAKRPCNITIKVGEPLLHIIPFLGNDIKAGYGPAEDHQIDAANSIFSSSKQFYRRYLQRRKVTSLEKIDEDIR